MTDTFTRLEASVRMLRMFSGLAARIGAWYGGKPPLRRETKDYKAVAAALAEMRDTTPSLNGCYHDGVAYSLAYDANGSVALCGETFTNLDIGITGGAKAALRRHRQNFDPVHDIPQFIVALKPVKINERSSGDGKAYGLPPGPLVGSPPQAGVWGEHVTNGRFDVIKRAVNQVKQDCERRGIDISKSLLTISVKPNDGQDAFARKCDDCSCPSCECDGTCDPDYATSCCRCDTWVCGYCVVEGHCHNCFSKIQGGVV